MMNTTGAFFIIMAIFWTSIMSFYSMLEMALISFNRLRLEYSVRKGSVRAVWIKKLLDNPTALFGTTLIGVNVSLVLSSESLRCAFETLNINPNYSVLISAPYMIIFGELVPMFAARLFPEHISRIGIPLLYGSSIFLAPIARLFDQLFRFLQTIFFSKTPSTNHLMVQKEELLHLMEESAVEYFDTETGQIASTVSKMFTLKDQEIFTIMDPFSDFMALQSTFLCGAAKERLLEHQQEIALCVNRQNKVIGHITAWDLLFANPAATIGSIIHPATYVSEHTTLLKTLLQMKKEQTEEAFVVGEGGEVVGFTSFDSILLELQSNALAPENSYHVRKTISASTKINDFAHTYKLHLPKTECKTFKSLLAEELGHKPSIGDFIRFGVLHITVKEVSIRGVKTIFVETTE